MASDVSTMEYLPKNLRRDSGRDMSSKGGFFEIASSSSASVASGSGI